MLPDPFVGGIEVSSLDWKDEVDAVIISESDVALSVARVALSAELDRCEPILKNTKY